MSIPAVGFIDEQGTKCYRLSYKGHELVVKRTPVGFYTDGRRTGSVKSFKQQLMEMCDAGEPVQEVEQPAEAPTKHSWDHVPAGLLLYMMTQIDPEDRPRELTCEIINTTLSHCGYPPDKFTQEDAINELERHIRRLG